MCFSLIYIWSKVDFMSVVELYEDARRVVSRLKDAGFSAYFAGGSVRDMIMGLSPDDIDIATSAEPEEIEDIFPQTYDIGAAFGIINVVENGINFEVATFREERGYADGRHPGEIRYTDDPALDAKRRDFTINSMFYDPLEDRILDFEGGEKDIRDKVLRSVGNAEARFSEDYLRILRAVRFSTRFGFTLERSTEKGIINNIAGLRKISNERVRDELNKMFTGNAPSDALLMLDNLGILDIILPEVSELKGVEQAKEFHPEGDVFVHTVLMFELMKNPTVELAWSVLLHDIGKPATFSRGDDGIEHFYSHDKIGAEIAEKILKRLKFPNSEIDNIVSAVRNHMKFAHVKEMRKAKLKRLMAEPSFQLQLDLHKLDCSSSHGKLDNYFFLKDILDNPEIETELPPPLLRGGDLMELGVAPGPEMGRILREIGDLQLDGKLNSKEDAIEYLLKMKDV
jgi:poly(A) polymerase